MSREKAFPVRDTRRVDVVREGKRVDSAQRVVSEKGEMEVRI